MNITLVTTYFYPEISPITHLYADLAEDLQSAGHEVTVVTSIANRGLTPDVRAEYLRRTDERAEAGYRILRVGSTAGEDLSTTIRRGLRLVRNTVSLYHAAKAVPSDVYLLGSMPPTLGYIGTFLNRKAPTVYILQDIFPDSVVQMGLFAPSHPLVRLARAMEKRIYARNSHFITISEDMKATLIKRGVPANRLSVIGNWTDPDAVRPVPREKNRIFDELGLSRSGFYAVYAGALGILQNPELIADAAALLSDCPDITFLVFGEGNRREALLARIRDKGLSNIKLFPLYSEDRVSEVYSLGDIALIPLKAGTTRIAVPSKTWTAMAAGRPVVCTAEPESCWARSISEAGCGLCVPPGDAAALAGAVRDLWLHPEQVCKMGSSARSAVVRDHSRRGSTGQYCKILEKEASSREHL